MKNSFLKRFFIIFGFILMFSLWNPLSSIYAEELEEPVDIEVDLPYEYVRMASCTLTISSSGTATVESSVTGNNITTSTSVTVYLEKLVNGSWQGYTSWTHSGGRVQDNTDSTSVAHGAYRVWMSVTATASGYGSESFNVDGNTVGY